MYQADAPEREETAQRAAQHCDEQILREQLPKDSRATGAKGVAYGHLLLPCRATRQQKIGDISTSDQQDECDCGQENDHGLSRATHHVIEQRHQFHLRAGAQGRVLLRDLALDTADLALGPIERDARPQTCDHIEPR